MRQVFFVATVLTVLASPAYAVNAEFYGQVNKALVWADGANGDKIIVGDNNRSSTRFGFRGEQAVAKGLTASFLIEGELSDGDATDVFDVSTTTDTASAAASTFTERHARVGLSGDFGTFFLGRTSSATDGITEIDLGSASDVMGSDLQNIGGGVGLGGGNTFAIRYNNLEGFDFNSDNDRVNLVRYDSPIYNGFQGSAAVANGGDFDLALRYGAKFGATEVKAGIGYVNFNQVASVSIPDSANLEQWSGSVSAKHDSGLNGTFAYGQQTADNNNLEPEFWYAKVGYDMGKLGLAIDYGTGEEFFSTGAESEAWGLGAQYNFGHGVSAAVLYRNMDLDVGATGFEGADLVAATMRVKF